MRNRFAISLLFVLSLPCLAAKDQQPLVAVVVYDSPSGPAYAQYMDFSLNGKREMYSCNFQPLTGNEYRKQTKIFINAGMVLSRTPDGALAITSDPKPSCVLPSNLKLEGGRTYQLKEIVDLAMIAGAGTASPNVSGPPPTTILPGMEIHVLTAPDAELAEYLRASRVNSIALWQDYLKLYAGSSHGGEARTALTTLIIADGEKILDSYRKANPKQPSDFENLRKARLAAAEANRVLPANAGSERLKSAVDDELQKELGRSRDELNAYLAAIDDKKPGLDHFAEAQAHLQNVVSADSAYPPADKVKGELLTQSELLANTITAAETQVAAGKFDQAYGIIARFKGFASEIPKVAAVIDAAFKYRRDKGYKYALDSNWEGAIAEYKKALEYNHDPSLAEQLKTAEQQFQAMQDTDTLQKAITDAEALTKTGQYLEAFQALEALPAPQKQQPVIAAEMEKLKRPYVNELTSRANQLTRVHVPIRGRSDENAVRQALDYLARASGLVDDDLVKIKRDQVSDKITEYYLQEGQRVLQKPRGSGVALGWLLLKEAEKYKPDNDELRNQLTRYTPDYNTRAKLSVGIRFRDQTSRRENPGFADQLADTLASGLESSGLPGVKAVVQQRLPDTDDGSSLTNFQLVGNIVNHQVEKKVDVQALTSHYRAGQREVKNPAWAELKRQVDTLQQQFDTTKIEAASAAAAKQKARAAELLASLEKITKDLNEARQKLDALPENTLQDIVQPYNYTKRTLQLVASIEVSFKLNDPYAQTSSAVEVIKYELPKSFVVLENVKPEDVDGVVSADAMPDEGQLLADAEKHVQSELVKKLVGQINQLPAKVLEQARAALARGDQEGAAERYVLYLNATAAKQSPERAEAQQFLRNGFNISTSIVQ